MSTQGFVPFSLIRWDRCLGWLWVTSVAPVWLQGLEEKEAHTKTWLLCYTQTPFDHATKTALYTWVNCTIARVDFTARMHTHTHLFSCYKLKVGIQVFCFIWFRCTFTWASRRVGAVAVVFTLEEGGGAGCANGIHCALVGDITYNTPRSPEHSTMYCHPHTAQHPHPHLPLCSGPAVFEYVLRWQGRWTCTEAVSITHSWGMRRGEGSTPTNPHTPKGFGVWMLLKHILLALLMHTGIHTYMKHSRKDALRYEVT